ncbi:MAG TPA: D-2-hydroxyacid dehydrogenase, partial [Candidatus Handelsmanbacteria bacterium]|nr:D-2-hydroxyacid dehydrogenase [Candidatus Handelsmanbacteria bacterium]
MSYRFVFLPPVNDNHRRWAESVRAEVDDIDILFAESREQALTELAEARAAFGTLDAE